MIYIARTGLQQKLTADAPDGGKRVRTEHRAAPKRDEGVLQHQRGDK